MGLWGLTQLPLGKWASPQSNGNVMIMPPGDYCCICRVNITVSFIISPDELKHKYTTFVVIILNENKDNDIQFWPNAFKRVIILCWSIGTILWVYIQNQSIISGSGDERVEDGAPAAHSRLFTIGDYLKWSDLICHRTTGLAEKGRREQPRDDPRLGDHEIGDVVILG